MQLKENLYLMSSTLLKGQWKDLKYIEKFNLFQEIQHLIELEIDAGRQVNQEEVIETLASAEIN